MRPRFGVVTPSTREQTADPDRGAVPAALKLVEQVSWPAVDLRVDWTEGCPIAALDALWRLYEPLDAYVPRALDPEAPPSCGH